MAEETEIIISIQLDQEGASTEMEKVRKTIMDLNAEKKRLNESYKEGTITQEEYIKQTIAVEGNIKKAQASYRDLTREQEINDNSINALRLSNKRLLEERNNLDLSTEAGKQRLKEINQEYQKNTDAIKANVSGYEQQKMGIGDYTGALSKFFPMLGPIAEGMDAVKEGMDSAGEGAEGANKSMWKMVMNPIGAIIAAIAGLLYLLYKGLTQTQGGTDMLEDAMASLSAIFTVIMDRIGKLASAFISFFSGDFDGAAEQFGEAVSGMGDEMAEAAREARELAAATRELEDATIDFEVASAETENTIKRLMLQAKNRTLSEQERIALLKKAEELEKGRVNAEIANADKGLNIAARELAQRLQLKKSASESEIEFGKRVMEAYKADNAAQADDLRDNLKDALIARQEAEAKSLNFQEKLQNQQDALADKAAEAEEKRRDKAEAAAQKAREKREKEQEQARAKKEKEDEKAAEAEKKRQEQEAERIEKDKDAANSLTLFKMEQKAKELNDATEKAKALTEIEQEKLRQELEDIDLTENEKTLRKEKTAAAIAQIEQDRINAVAKAEADARKQQAETETAEKEKRIAEAKAVKDAKLKYANEALNGLQSIAAEGTILNKAAALAQIAIDTGEAISGLTAASEQNPANAVTFGGAGALQFAAGLVRIFGNIAQAKKLLGFAEGGLSGTRVDSTHGIPISRSNGDNILATIRTGEVILNERQQAALGGADTFRRIGVPGFAKGGIAGFDTMDASRLNRTSIQMDEILKSMSEQRPVLVLEEFEYASSRKSLADKNAVIV